MTDTEKNIAEVLDLSKPVSDCPECGGLGEIGSLGSRRKCECLYIRLKTLKRELDRKEECTEENPCRECLKKSVDGYKEIVRELEEKNRKLQEERDEWGRTAQEAINTVFVRDHQLQSAQQEIEALRQERNKLIEGLRWYADKTNYVQEVHHFWHGTLIEPAEAIYYDGGQRARDILKEIGVTME